MPFCKSLLSKSEDLDLINKFNIVFTMVKKHISQASFHNMCSAAALFAPAALLGPDIVAVDEVKVLILESVNACKNYKERVPSRGSQGPRGPCAQKRPRDEECLLSERVATLGT